MAAASQIFFILGSDAFAEIATWREYPAVLDTRTSS
jgi:nicotinic acid mononucleotide adenylyltransferase